MCCQLAAADQWNRVKEAATGKVLDESNRSAVVVKRPVMRDQDQMFDSEFVSVFKDFGQELDS